MRFFERGAAEESLHMNSARFWFLDGIDTLTGFARSLLWFLGYIEHFKCTAPGSWLAFQIRIAMNETTGPLAIEDFSGCCPRWPALISPSLSMTNRFI